MLEIVIIIYLSYQWVLFILHFQYELIIKYIVLSLFIYKQVLVQRQSSMAST